MKKITVVELLDTLYGNEGRKISLLVNGKPTSRRVYYRSDCGLYIVVNRYPIFEYEVRYTDTYTIEQEEV
jgi:hypothetical protein